MYIQGLNKRVLLLTKFLGAAKKLKHLVAGHIILTSFSDTLNWYTRQVPDRKKSKLDRDAILN